MNEIRVGVVGVGALGRHHARILSELPGVRLVGVADAHAERGRDVAAKHGTRWVADHRELLSEVDAVSVVVPTVAHLAVAADFLRAKIPVMLEKPLADSVAAGQTLVDLADQHGTLLQVGHIERFNPAWQAAAPWCAAPRYLRTERCSNFTFRSTDIGVVLDLMIHDLDLVLSLVRSPIASVEAFGIGVMGTHEDAVQARLRFENGTLADLTASRIHPTVARTVTAWSRFGCITTDLQQRKVTRYTPSPALLFGESPIAQSQRPGANLEELKASVFGELLEVHELEVAAGDALTAELRSFLEAVRLGRPPVVDGHQALAAMQAAQLVLESVADHGWHDRPAATAAVPSIHDHAMQRPRGRAA